MALYISVEMNEIVGSSEPVYVKGLFNGGNVVLVATDIGLLFLYLTVGKLLISGVVYIGVK